MTLYNFIGATSNSNTAVGLMTSFESVHCPSVRRHALRRRQRTVGVPEASSQLETAQTRSLVTNLRAAILLNRDRQQVSWQVPVNRLKRDTRSAGEMHAQSLASRHCNSLEANVAVRRLEHCAMLKKSSLLQSWAGDCLSRITFHQEYSGTALSSMWMWHLHSLENLRSHIDHDRFLPKPFQFIIHNNLIIRQYKLLSSWSVDIGTQFKNRYYVILTAANSTPVPIALSRILPEKLFVPLAKKFPRFMVPKGSFQLSRKPATGPVLVLD